MSLFVAAYPAMNEQRDVDAREESQHAAHLPRRMRQSEEDLLAGGLREPGEEIDGIGGSEQVMQEVPLPLYI